MPPLAGAGRGIVGIDIGGTKIAAAIVTKGGTFVERRVVPTSAGRGALGVLGTLVGLVDDLRREASAQAVTVLAVGVATAGMVDRSTGVVSRATDAFPDLLGLPLREELERQFGLPVVLLNDVHAMAIGEQSAGSGDSDGHALYVVVGTGVGGALTRAGSLVLGDHGFAGDIGHVVIDSSPTARRCPCGRLGHLEAYVSGPALAREYERRSGCAPLDGDLQPVAARASGGERLARDVLREGAQFLGRAVGGLVNLLDPEIVVFGGGLLGLDGSLFWDRVGECLTAEVRSGSLPRVERARLGNDAAIVGAGLAAFHAAPWLRQAEENWH